jgi:hypothetical protein
VSKIYFSEIWRKGSGGDLARGRRRGFYQVYKEKSKNLFSCPLGVDNSYFRIEKLLVSLLLGYHFQCEEKYEILEISFPQCLLGDLYFP